MDGNGNLSVYQKVNSLNSMNAGQPVPGDPGISGANAFKPTPVSSTGAGGQDRYMREMFRKNDQGGIPRPILDDVKLNSSSTA
jgi:hypothetical protein